MALTCTRCGGSGFLNIHQVGDGVLSVFDETGDHKVVLDWMISHDDHDVQVCDCCGDGDGWYGMPGEHYNSDDPPGRYGPYACNGGWCKCHYLSHLIPVFSYESAINYSRWEENKHVR